MRNEADHDTASFSADCELCAAARFTHWYFEDNLCWVADCEACLTPMVVWKQHGTNPPEADRLVMLSQLEAAAELRFGDASVRISEDMRTIPDHWHAHARDDRWHVELQQRRLSRFNGVGGERIER